MEPKEEVSHEENELLVEDIEKQGTISTEPFPRWRYILLLLQRHRHNLKIRSKMCLDIITNFILPAVDECTDLYSGIRYLV